MSTNRAMGLRALWMALLCAISVSIAPTAQDFPRIPPQYSDARTIRPVFGIITVTLQARGTVKETRDTTATMSARVQKVIECTPEGGTARLSATGHVTAVTVRGSTTDREETSYALDPSEREVRTLPGAPLDCDLVASDEQQSSYFSIPFWAFRVKAHTAYTSTDGGSSSIDLDYVWKVRVPNHTRASPPLEAAGDDTMALGGIVEVPGANGRSAGSYTVPILLGRLHADTEPMLRKHGMLDREYPGVVPGTITVTWSLTPAPPDIEAVFEPSGQAYYHWRPYPGADEDTAGDTLTFSARIHKRGDPDEPASQRATFKFELTDVTREPGVCMNWPSDTGRSEPQFDLKIEQARNPELTLESTQVARSKKGQESAEVVISSFDGAPWGRLQVTAILDDGTEVPAHLKDDRSVTALTIPKDDDENHIADVWEKNFGVAGSDASADEDATPPPAEHPGDGFSIFEEYRGFWVQGEFMDTDPKVKDLFIYDVANVGIGFFGVTDLTMHLVELEEYGQEGNDPEHNLKVVNVNRGRATRGAQHLLSLEDWSLSADYGRAQGGPGVPASVRRVMIDVDACRKAGRDQGFGQAFLDNTIAHELLHGCNVFHHGAGNYEIPEISGPGGTLVGKLHVARRGGQHSGAMDCLMRYNSDVTVYEKPGGRLWWRAPSGEMVHGEPYEADPPGTTLCETKGAGSDGVPPKVGVADRGECRKQLNVNDNNKE